MNKNFEVKCGVDEVAEIGGNINLSTMMFIVQSFYELQTKHFDSKDYKWSHFCAASDLFIMGYISGVRAEREKKNRTKQ